jgi:hypothetical protein
MIAIKNIKNNNNPPILKIIIIHLSIKSLPQKSLNEKKTQKKSQRKTKYIIKFPLQIG